MKIVIFTLFCFFTVAPSAFADGNLFCYGKSSNGDTLTVVIGSSMPVLMLCEAPVSADTSNPDYKSKYCAASTMLLTGQFAGNISKSLSGVTSDSVLNSLPEGMSVKLSFASTSDLSNAKLELDQKVTLPLGDVFPKSVSVSCRQ